MTADGAKKPTAVIFLFYKKTETQTKPRKRKTMKRRTKIALVLSSGGARGYVHIGAIEELEAQGYEITSIAGTSMGALIGGMYAAGKLPEVSEWMRGLDAKQVFSLTDISLALNHIVKGEKVMQALKKIVPDVRIEELAIPYCAVASDMTYRREMPITEGSLYEAIRASISIPSFFKPVKKGDSVLVDGGLTNPLPLDRVRRTEDDLLVAINVSAPSDNNIPEIKKRAQQMHRRGMPLWERIALPQPAVESNYYTLLSKSFSLMIERNAQLSLRLTPPDVLVNVPVNRFGSYDYTNAEKMIRHGRAKMREALYEWQRIEKETY